MSNPTRGHLLLLGKSMALISAIAIVGYLVVQAQRSSQGRTLAATPPTSDAVTVPDPDGAPLEFHTLPGTTPGIPTFLLSSKSGIVVPPKLEGSEGSPSFLGSSKSLSPEALKALDAQKPAAGAGDPPAANDVDG